MIFKNFQSDVTSLQLQRNFLFVISGLMLLLSIILSIALLNKEKQTILVPVGFSKEMHVSDRSVSSSYMHEMSYFFSNFLLDIVPESFPAKKSLILRYVSPESYGKLSHYLDTEIKRYKKYNLRTAFKIHSLKIDPANLTTDIEGFLYSWFGKGGKKTEKITLRIKFSFKNRLLLLQGFDIIKRGAIDA